MAVKQIEQMIQEVLTGETRANALDFVAHLRDNGIPIQESEGYWDIAYQGKSLCFIMITGSEEAPGPFTIWSDQEPGSFVTWPEGEHADCPVDERVRETAWKHVNFCASCGGDCSPGLRKVVLGRAFDGVCSSALAFTDPDAEALECAKAMVDVRKRDIIKGA